jgi:predicted DNA-binding transcriptional regulator AlpA
MTNQTTEVTKAKKIIRFPHICTKTGLPRSTIYRLIALGKFPKQIKLPSSRTVEKLYAFVKKFKGKYEWLVAKLPARQTVAKLYFLIKIFNDIYVWLGS